MLTGAYFLSPIIYHKINRRRAGVFLVKLELKLFSFKTRIRDHKKYNTKYVCTMNNAKYANSKTTSTQLNFDLCLCLPTTALILIQCQPEYSRKVYLFYFILIFISIYILFYIFLCLFCLVV